MVEYRDLYFQMDSCISCGLCSVVCPVMQKTGAARAPILGPLFPSFGSRWDVYTHLNGTTFCTECGVCRDACPRQIDIPSVITWVRHEAHKAGEELPAVQSFVKSIVENGHPYGASETAAPAPEERTSLDGGTPRYFFFPGCAGRVFNPQMLEAWKQLAEELDFEFTSLGEQQTCCGAPLQRWGYRDEARTVAEETARLIAERCGPDTTIVTDCPHCLVAFKDEYPDLLDSFKYNVIHTSELVSGMLESRGWNENGKDDEEDNGVAYLNPCLMADYAGGDPGTGLARRLGPVWELGREACCGAGEAVDLVQPEVTRDLSAQLESRVLDRGTSNTVLTGCPHCWKALDQTTGLRTLDLLQYAVERVRESRQG